MGTAMTRGKATQMAMVLEEKGDCKCRKSDGNGGKEGNGEQRG